VCAGAVQDQWLKRDGSIPEAKLTSHRNCSHVKLLLQKTVCHTKALLDKAVRVAHFHTFDVETRRNLIFC
jgi:hypothetical protein